MYDRSRAEHHLFLLYNEAKFHASVVKFLGMSITFVNMDHLSNLAAFIESWNSPSWKEYQKTIWSSHLWEREPKWHSLAPCPVTYWNLPVMGALTCPWRGCCSEFLFVTRSHIEIISRDSEYKLQQERFHLSMRKNLWLHAYTSILDRCISEPYACVVKICLRKPMFIPDLLTKPFLSNKSIAVSLLTWDV